MKITFDTMPEAIEHILHRLDEMDIKLSGKYVNTPSSPPEEILFNVHELCDYLPMRPKKQTVYGWVSAKPPKIPYHKKGTLYFVKSEIDSWLAEDGRASHNELMAQARDYIENNNGKRK